jgi:hypothetical protein
MYLIGTLCLLLFFLNFALALAVILPLPWLFWNNKEALDRFPPTGDISAPENFYFLEFA